MNSLGGAVEGHRQHGGPFASKRHAEELVTELYGKFGGTLFAHVLGWTNHDRQWTEDVVQETLIRAWQNSENLVRDPRMLHGWLLTVARRIVIDGWRSRQARPREVELTSPNKVVAPDETDRALSLMVITDVIGKLGEDHRATIYETYVRGRTIKEAAIVLGIPEGTVKSRLYTAMQILRRALRERN